MIRGALWLISWLLAPLMAEAAQPPPQSILVLNESAMVGPFYSGAYAALRSTIAANSSHPVAMFVEQLELERFGGDRYERTLRTYLGSKYGEQPIGVIVALGFAALDFVSRVCQEMWSEVPVVFVMVDDEALKKLRPLPNVTGRTARVKFRDSLSAARAAVPNLRSLAIVGDDWETQTAYRHFKDEISVDATGLQIIDLVGLPMRELRKRVAVLPEDAAIVYTSIFSDGEGTSYPPVDALGFVAEVANRPIIHAAETFVGHGGIGGYVLTPAAVGKEAADLALRILNGERAASIPVIEGDVVRPIFDWRELQRWGVDESRLPEGSEIRFRTPTLWQQYRMHLFAVLAVLLVQSALIMWLIYEHRRRRAAERTARSTMSELTHLNRVATAGELSASIAHEVKQPIAGIMVGAGLALRSLVGRTPDLEKVRTILQQIVNASRHANEILENIRASFKKSTQTTDHIDINKLILMVLDLTRFELQAQSIEVRTQLGPLLPSVVGNAVQLQQVILNLVMNAVEAMHGSTSRVLTVKSGLLETDVVHVSIEDTGIGIDRDNLERVFEPMFTTKAGGMGMGLAICRSIIESHRGVIWVSAGAERGSAFKFAIPIGNDRREIRRAS